MTRKDVLDRLDKVHADAEAAARCPKPPPRPPAPVPVKHMTKGELIAQIRQKLDGFTERQKVRAEQRAAKWPGMREYGKVYRALGK